MKKFLFNVIYILIMIVFLFAVSEILFRIFRGAPNPLASITQKKKEHLFEPNSEKHMSSSVEGEFEYTARINSLGYRGKDFSAEKDPRTLRIFAVGDSFTFGVGSDDDKTIPSLLEQKLSSEKQRVEVINAGIGHASPITHYVNIRDMHLQFQPDIVVLLLDFTDLWDDWHSERSAVYDKQGNIVRFDPMFIDGKRSWWITCCNYSAFCKWINNKIVRTFKKIKTLGLKEYVKKKIEGKRAKAAIINSDKVTSAATQIEYDGLLMLRGRQKKELIDSHFPRTAKYILKIKDLLDQNQIPMVLVMYPHGIYVGGDQWKDGRLTWGFEAGKKYTDYYVFEIVEAFAKKNQIPFVNTLPAFDQAEEKKYFFDWDGHLNSDGNEVVAQALVQSPAFRETVFQSVFGN